VAEDAALRFAERLLALLDATRYFSDLQARGLLALIDVTAERTGPDGTGPGRAVGQRGGPARHRAVLTADRPLRSGRHSRPRALSQAPQNDIPAKLAGRREPAGRTRRGSRTAGRTLKRTCSPW
jgi:hypothetical protein